MSQHEIEDVVGDSIRLLHEHERGVRTGEDARPPVRLALGDVAELEAELWF